MLVLEWIWHYAIHLSSLWSKDIKENKPFVERNKLHVCNKLLSSNIEFTIKFLAFNRILTKIYETSSKIIDSFKKFILIVAVDDTYEKDEKILWQWWSWIISVIRFPSEMLQKERKTCWRKIYLAAICVKATHSFWDFDQTALE